MTPSEFLQVFFFAASPIAELRGAIPYGLWKLQLSWPLVLAVSIAGNILPIPFLLLLLGPISRLASRVKLFDSILKWIFERSRRRGKNLDRAEFWGLALFVGIPLPVTGAWTGSIVAFLLGMNFWRAFFAIALGVLIAAAIVTPVAVLLHYAFFVHLPLVPTNTLAPP